VKNKYAAEGEVRFTDSWLYTHKPEPTEWVKKNRAQEVWYCAV